MNCTHCHSNYETGAQYCPNCGNKTLYNPTLGKSNNNVTAVWLFAGMFIFMGLFFRFVSHVIMPVLRKGENWERIGTFYKIEGILILLLELLVCGVVIGIIKNTSARIAVGLYGLTMLFLFVLDKVMEAANLGAYGNF